MKSKAREEKTNNSCILNSMIRSITRRAQHNGSFNPTTSSLPIVMPAVIIPPFLIRRSPTVARTSWPPMSQTTAHRSHFTTSPRSSEHTQFTYRLAAASSAKSTPRRQPQLHRDVFPFSSTHADPRALYLRSSKPDAGEDAFFASTVGGNRHRVAFGVADGVGGWQASGVDPSYFSHGLCGYMARTAYTLQGLQRKDVGTVTPRDLLQVAYNAVIADEGIRAGGSTASLGVVDGQGMLETAKYVDHVQVTTGGNSC